MKKFLSLLMTLILLVQCLPVPALALDQEERAEAYEFLASHGFDIEKAMDAYAANLFSYIRRPLQSMNQREMLAFRKCVQETYTDRPLLQRLIDLGFDVAENNFDQGSDANERALYVKTLLLLAETENLNFHQSVEAIQSAVPEYTLVQALGDAAFTLLMKGVDLTLAAYTKFMKGIDFLDDMPKSTALVTRTKTQHPAAFLQRLYDDFLTGAYKGIYNAGKIVDGAIKFDDSGKALYNLRNDTAALANITMSYQRVQHALSILNQLSANHYDNENLKAACNALDKAYEAFGKETQELAQTDAGRAKLSDGAYLNQRLNALIAEQVLSSVDDVIDKFWAAALTVADIILTGGIVTFTANLTNQMTDLNFGTKNIFAQFHAMVVADRVYQELAWDTFQNEPASGDSWRDYYAHAKKVQRLCKLGLMGETHIYELTTRDPDTAGLIVDMGNLAWDKTEENTIWYNGQKADLENTYNIAQEFMDALDQYYLELSLLEPDVTPYLGREDAATATLAGTLKEDFWFAKGDGTSTPNYEHRNEKHAQEPLADMPVYLIVDKEVVAASSTDNAGEYTLTFPVAKVEGKSATLRIGDETTELEYAIKEIEGLVYANGAFRSSFPYLAAIGETSAQADSAEVSAAFPYSDRYFLGKSTEYNHNLAIASLGLSAAAMNDPAADGSWTANANAGRDANVLEAWNRMGFSVVGSYHYDTSLNGLHDTAAYTIATKIIEDPNTRNGFAKPEKMQQYRVVGVAIRGDVTTAELAAALSSTSQGGTYQDSISSAAYEMAETVGSYLQSVYDEEIPTRVWITGFSRGGALTNALSAILASSPRYMTTFQSLYAYAFASPTCMTSSAASTGNGVFNLIYDQDLFATGLWKAAGSKQRLGETLTFGAANLGNYNESLIASLFHKLSQGNANYIPSLYKADTLPLEELNTRLESELESASLYTRGLEGVAVGLVQWLMLRNSAGGDPAEITTQEKHVLAEAAAEAARTAGNSAGSKLMTGAQSLMGALSKESGLQAEINAAVKAATSSETNILLAALSDEPLDNLRMILNDALLLGAAAQDRASLDLHEDLTENLIFLVSTLMNDLALPFSTDSMAFGHHPEVYMAWLMGSSGVQLVSKEDPRIFNAYVLPQPINLMGVVYDKETKEILPDVDVTIQGHSKTYHLRTDEKGEWEACVKPGDYTLYFDLAGYEQEKETVSRGQFNDPPVKLETWLEPLPLPTVVMTTTTLYEEAEHYYAEIVEPHVYCREYPEFGNVVAETIGYLYEEAYSDMVSDKRGAASCTYRSAGYSSDHFTIARPNHAYTNGHYFSLGITHGYFVCSIGHNCTELTGFCFDIAAGKPVELNELLNPENPEAEAQFKKLLQKTIDEAVAQKPGSEVVSAKKLYNHLVERKWCAWSLLNDGLTISLSGMNLSFGVYTLFIPYEQLEGIFSDRAMPAELIGESEFAMAVRDPAELEEAARLEAAEKTRTVWINRNSSAAVMAFDGVVDHLWMDKSYGRNSSIDSRCTWFYGFGMRNPKITLPGLEDTAFDVSWQDKQGEYFETVDAAFAK